MDGEKDGKEETSSFNKYSLPFSALKPHPSLLNLESEEALSPNPPFPGLGYGYNTMQIK